MPRVHEESAVFGADPEHLARTASVEREERLVLVADVDFLVSQARTADLELTDVLALQDRRVFVDDAVREAPLGPEVLPERLEREDLREWRARKVAPDPEARLAPVALLELVDPRGPLVLKDSWAREERLVSLDCKENLVFPERLAAWDPLAAAVSSVRTDELAPPGLRVPVALLE